MRSAANIYDTKVNSQVYSNLSHTLDLGPNPYAVKIPPEYLPYLSTSYQHNLVSLAISHRIHQLPEGTSSIVLKTLRLRIHHHHSIAVQAVRRCIEIEAPVISNTITGEILNLMFVEVCNSPSQLRNGPNLRPLGTLAAILAHG